MENKRDNDVGTATLRRLMSSPVAVHRAHERGVAQRISILQELEEKARNEDAEEVEKQSDITSESEDDAWEVDIGEENGPMGLSAPPLTRKSTEGISRLLARHERRKERAEQLDSLAASLSASINARSEFHTNSGLKSLRHAATQIRLALAEADAAVGKDGVEEEEEEEEEEVARGKTSRGSGRREEDVLVSVPFVEPPGEDENRSHVLVVMTDAVSPSATIRELVEGEWSHLYVQSTRSGERAVEAMLDEECRVEALVLDVGSMVGAERAMAELKQAGSHLVTLPWVVVCPNSAAELRRRKEGRALMRLAHQLGCASLVEGSAGGEALAARLGILLKRYRRAKGAAEEVAAGKTLRAPVQYRVADSMDARLGGWKAGLVGQAGVEVGKKRRGRDGSLRESARRMSDAMLSAVDERSMDAIKIFASRSSKGESKLRSLAAAAAASVAQWTGSADLEASDARARNAGILNDQIRPSASSAQTTTSSSSTSSPTNRGRRSSVLTSGASDDGRPLAPAIPLPKAILDQVPAPEILHALLTTTETPAQRRRKKREAKRQYAMSTTANNNNNHTSSSSFSSHPHEDTVGPTSLDAGRYSPRRAAEVKSLRVIPPALIDPRAGTRSPSPPPSALDRLPPATVAMLRALARLAKACKLVPTQKTTKKSTQKSTKTSSQPPPHPERNEILAAARQLRDAADGDTSALISDINDRVTRSRKENSPSNTVGPNRGRTTIRTPPHHRLYLEFHAVPLIIQLEEENEDQVDNHQKTRAFSGKSPPPSKPILSGGSTTSPSKPILSGGSTTSPSKQPPRPPPRPSSRGRSPSPPARSGPAPPPKRISAKIEPHLNVDTALASPPAVGRWSSMMVQGTMSDEDGSQGEEDSLGTASEGTDLPFEAGDVERVTDVSREILLRAAKLVDVPKLRKRLEEAVLEEDEAVAEAGIAREEWEAAREARHTARAAKIRDFEELVEQRQGLMTSLRAVSTMARADDRALWGSSAKEEGSVAAALESAVGPDALLQSSARDLPPSVAVRNATAKALPLIRQGLGLDTAAPGADEQAVQCFSNALAADRRCIVSRILRATSLIRLGRAADALEDLERVLHRRPNHRTARFNRAVALACLHRGDEAVEELNRLLDTHDDTWPHQRKRSKFAPIDLSKSASELEAPAEFPGAGPGAASSSSKKATPRGPTTTKHPRTQLSGGGGTSTSKIHPTPRSTASKKYPTPRSTTSKLQTPRGLSRTMPRPGSSRSTVRMAHLWAADPSALRLRGLLRRRMGDFAGAYDDYAAAVVWERRILRGECRGPDGELPEEAARSMREELKRHAKTSAALPTSGGGFVGAWNLQLDRMYESKGLDVDKGLAQESTASFSTISLPGHTGPVPLFSKEAKAASLLPRGAPPILSASLSTSMLTEASAANRKHRRVVASSGGGGSIKAAGREDSQWGDHKLDVGTLSRADLVDSSASNPFRPLAVAESITLGRHPHSHSHSHFHSHSHHHHHHHGSDPVDDMPSPRGLTLQLSGMQTIEAVPQAVVPIESIVNGRTDLYIIARPSELEQALEGLPGSRSGEEVAVIRHALAAVPLFRAWPTSLQTEVAQRLRLKRVGSGQTFQREGMEPTSLGIVIEGVLDIRVAVIASLASGKDDDDDDDEDNDEQLQRQNSNELSLRKGVQQKSDVTVGSLRTADPVGDLPLLFGPERALTVVGGSGGAVLVELERRDFFALRVDEAILAQLRARADAFRRTGGFSGFSTDELLRLACVARERSVPADTSLVVQGSVPRALYVLLRGTCTVHRSPDKVAAVNAAIVETAARLSDLNWAFPYHRSLLTEPHTRIPLPDALKPKPSSSEPTTTTTTSSTATAKKSSQKSHPPPSKDSSLGGIEGEKATAVDEARAALKEELYALFRQKVQLLLEDRARVLERRKERLEEAARKKRQRDRMRRALRTASSGASRRGTTVDFAPPRLPTDTLSDSEDDLDGDDQGRVHISDLHPVQLFGEQCLVGSDGVAAPATVSTTTFADILEIPAPLIDRALFSNSDLDRIAERGPPNPPESEIEARLGEEGRIKRITANLLARIPKHRWPIDKRRIRQTPGGKTVVLPADKVPGATLAKSEIGLEELIKMTK